MNVQRGVDDLSRTSANGVGRAFFPAVQADVDLEQNHDNEQDRAERDLRPFVKLVAAANFHLIDAPGEHEHDADHRQAHDVDHQRRARPARNHRCQENRTHS